MPHTLPECGGCYPVRKNNRGTGGNSYLKEEPCHQPVLSKNFSRFRFLRQKQIHVDVEKPLPGGAAVKCSFCLKVLIHVIQTRLSYSIILHHAVHLICADLTNCLKS